MQYECFSYRWLMITFMFFSRTHFTRAIYWYTTIMYTYIIIICTRRRNARPVNINHIVTRSRTIIRSAAVLLHGRRRWRLWSAAWKIIFNVFQLTFCRWKTEKVIQIPPPRTDTARLQQTIQFYIICDVYLQIWGRVFLSTMRTTVDELFFLYLWFIPIIILISTITMASKY